MFVAVVLMFVIAPATAEILLYITPHKVIINEYLEISKAFFPNSKETKLVNAVLDKVIQTMPNVN